MSIELDVINEKLNELNLEGGCFGEIASIDSLTRASRIALLKQLLKDIEAKDTVELAEHQAKDSMMSLQTNIKDMLKKMDKLHQEASKKPNANTNNIDEYFRRHNLQAIAYADECAKELKKIEAVNKSYAAKSCFEKSIKAIEAMKTLKLPDVPSIQFLYAPNIQLPDIPKIKFSDMPDIPEVPAGRNSASANYSACDKCVDYEKGVELYSQYLKDRVKEQLEIARWNSTMAMFNLKKPSLYNPFMGVATIRN
ncbi:MAG: hypothetical protein KAJ39_03115 [Gammaproteobacteria bacterium]|nr:hypothetical protein [Gammaproteobacteria bacterium]